MNTEQYFLHLVTFDTQSNGASKSVPSTPGQKVLAAELVRMLKAIGVENASTDENGYVYAKLPATDGVCAPAIGFVAHMDTSPDCSGKDIRARVIPDYDGEDILLNAEKQIVLPAKPQHKGQRLIVTDGTTLLGADNKAGVAEILTMAEELLKSGKPHGEVDICFTPDEEIGRGTDHFNIETFAAKLAYTVDGSACSDLEFENFNAASADVTVHGLNTHPGGAKGKMKNAMRIAMEFHGLLPANEIPEATCGYEGFAHLNSMQGTVEEAKLHYIIRDHDREKLERRKERFRSNERFLNEKYGEETVEVKLADTYSNMKEMILPHFELIEWAEAAMRAAGVEPVRSPIRGGTDGAMLSYMGIPCPNLGTGGYGFHSRMEYAVVDEMETVVRILLNIVEKVRG